MIYAELVLRLWTLYSVSTSLIYFLIRVLSSSVERSPFHFLHRKCNKSRIMSERVIKTEAIAVVRIYPKKF